MMEGRGVTDTAEGPENTTMHVQMEEEQRAIRALSYVTKMSFVRAVKDKVQGVLVSLPISSKLRQQLSLPCVIEGLLCLTRGTPEAL